MKAVKLLMILCVVAFLISLPLKSVLAQNTETRDSVITKPLETIKSSPEGIADGTLSLNRQTNEKYRIGFQDTLEIQVFRHPELSQVVNVSPDGTILMPKIDRPIVAVCKTERELKENVETLYKSYLRNPFVNVRAVEQRSQPFAVIGAVEKPGSFYLNRKIRLLELLAFAGGPKVEKSGSKIQVARVGNISGCVENNDETQKEVVFLSYRINDVLSGKDNPEMQPGDIVSVLEAEQAYVVGNVNKATTISLKEPVTLTQAIAIAEGLDDTANTGKIIVQRQAVGTQGKTELVYSLKDIRDKKIPDPFLQANDIVEVSNDKNKSLKKGLFDLIKSIVPTAAYRL